MLCSIGLFDAEKMNQGIFGFRRYENSSLSYTGIDKHEGEAVGGWDTVLKRDEYEKLYAGQQATITDFETVAVDDTSESETDMSVALEHTVANHEQLAQKRILEKLSCVNVGTEITHKIFGSGAVSWMDKAKKYIRIKFAVGEKQFVFPDAFIDGYLALKE